MALWEAIDADPRALAFGLWLGRTVSLPALGVVGYVMQHAPDLRAALACLERFNGLLGEGIGPAILERDEHVVSIAWSHPASPACDRFRSRPRWERSQSSPFNRAFRRWTGQNPSAFRGSRGQP